VEAVVTNPRTNLQAIYDFQWPDYLLKKWRDQFPLAPEGIEQEVALGLTEWFVILAAGHPRTFGMTSKSIDALWHELILNTRLYTDFCTRVVGFFVHHATNEADLRPNAALEQHLDTLRTWMAACQLEGIDPRHPLRLPRLFSLDAMICPESGHVFSLEAQRNPSQWLSQST
jgi:hypothetical protein